MPLAEYDEPRKTLGLDRSNEFFTPAVEIWGRDRQRICLQAVLLQQLGESCRVFHISVVEQNSRLGCA